jgi:hypothetical protein
MPAPGLIFHEWDQHGTCSGLEAREYFDVIRKARTRVKIPPQYADTTVPLRVTPNQVVNDFINANEGLAPTGITIDCDRTRLREVRICFSRDLKFRECSRGNQRSCRTEKLIMPPAETALVLCRAHSAGLSLLEEGDQKSSFHWRAIAGQWSPHLNGGRPRNFGPCGTVLDRNIALLCSHPERDFPYFGEVTPLLEEGLLIPFYIKGEAIGTIWVVAHDANRRFDAEDLRVMTSLATFAAAAYPTGHRCLGRPRKTVPGLSGCQ